MYNHFAVFLKIIKTLKGYIHYYENNIHFNPITKIPMSIKGERHGKGCL